MADVVNGAEGSAEGREVLALRQLLDLSHAASAALLDTQDTLLADLRQRVYGA
jgi:hypothetical protein